MTSQNLDPVRAVRRFGSSQQPPALWSISSTRPASTSTSSSTGILPQQSRAQRLGLGLGSRGVAQGLGVGGRGGLKRQRKVQRDTIYGVTKGDIRRLARRGGVKRIAGTVYTDIRAALKERLKNIMKDVIAVVEYGGRKTITVTDIVFVLNRQGRPIYGFEPAFTGTRRE